MSGNSDGQDLTVHSFHEVSLAALTHNAPWCFMSKKCNFDLICNIRETKEAPRCTRAATTTSTHTVSTPRRRFVFNFVLVSPSNKTIPTNLIKMETEVEIDVGQESFPTRKVGHISSLCVWEILTKLQVEVEANPAIMASLTSMEQDVPSLQVFYCCQLIDIIFQFTAKKVVTKPTGIPLFLFWEMCCPCGNHLH